MLLHKLGLLFLGSLSFFLSGWPETNGSSIASVPVQPKWNLYGSMPIPGNAYRLESVSNGKVIEIEDGLFNKGSKVQQYRAYDRNGIVDGFNQEWIFIPCRQVNGVTEYFIFNNGFLNFLDAGAASSTTVAAKDGAEHSGQRWRLLPAGELDTYFIQSVATGKNLQAPTTSNDGDTYILAAPSKNRNQMFRIIEYGWKPLSYSIDNSQLLSDANQGYAVNGTWVNGSSVQLTGPCTDCPSTSFDIVPVEGHYVKLQHKEGSKTFAVDVAGWNANSGEKAVIWEVAEVEKQKWLLVSIRRRAGFEDFDSRRILFNKVSGRALEVSNGIVNYSSTLRVNMFANKPHQKWLFKRKN